MIKIYHNSRCAKSRAGLNYLLENNIDHEVVEYLKINLTKNDIKNLIQKTGQKPFDLVRTNEAYFKENLKGKTFTDEEWFDIIAQNPKLLHRPIFIKGDKAIWGQPPDKVNDLLK